MARIPLFGLERSCNTAACAVGLACDIRDLEGWSAVKTFFDLVQVQAVRLFAEHSYEVTEGEATARGRSSADSANDRHCLTHF